MATPSPAIAWTLALTALAAGPSASDDAPKQAGTITGQASAVCKFGAPMMLTGSNAVFSHSVSGATLAIDRLADGATGLGRSASIGLNLDSICNQPSRIRIRSLNGGLGPVDGGPKGQAPGRLDYVVTVSWGNERTVLRTDGSPGGFVETPLLGANASGLTIDIDIPAGTDPLVASDYLDTLVIEFLTGM